MKISAIVFMTASAAILIAGCDSSPSGTGPPPDLQLPVAGQASSGVEQQPGPVAGRHDFGVVLAHGQKLIHKFKLSSPSMEPVRVLSAATLTPCCSEVLSFPAVIPPGDSVELEVSWSIGSQIGQKGVQFLVKADLVDRSTWLLETHAELVPEVAFFNESSAGDTVPLGRPERRTYRIVCNRSEGAGRSAPTSVDAPEPLTVQFVGGVEECRVGDLIETSRCVAVEIPASVEPGQRRGALEFRWDDGEIRTEIIGWRVVPRIQVAPAGIILGQGRASRTIVLCADDRPFRITGIDGPLLPTPPGPSAEESWIHTVRLDLDPSQGERGQVYDIRIATDHPDQPSVTVSVLLSAS